MQFSEIPCHSQTVMPEFIMIYGLENKEDINY